MRILVTYPLSSELVQSGLGDLVVYRPELASRSESALLHALGEHLPDATLVNGRCPGAAALAAWQARAGREVTLIRCHPGDEPPRIDLPGVGVDQIRGAPSNPRDDVRALGLAERSIMRLEAARRLASCDLGAHASRTLSGSRVTLVGAGIVNLMTALHLAEKGAEIEILEASPDPRGQPHWQRLGTTHGGDNARLFSFAEADNYNERGQLAHAKMHQVFGQTITRGGWLAREPEQLDRRERAWIERFRALPRWRAEVFAEDIHAFTVGSYPLWKQLRQSAPRLLEGVGYTPGILQVYAQREMAEAAEALHAKLGSLKRVLDAGELMRRHPACRDAVENGQIAGGLEVRGFTLNIHDFVAKLLAHLERRGVQFRWNQRVTAIARASDGGITGLETPNGAVHSEHYVLSPGAHGHDLLEGTRSAGKIQGILGLWLSLPDLAPRLRHSIKLHREGHVGEHSNVTLAKDACGRPILILSAGYGYLGCQSLDMASPEVECLFEALEETARRYFPRAYGEAMAGGTLSDSRKACVRPFTSTGLGVFDVSGTADGGRMVIASGHNTGGFAQAPAVAEAVTATLEGRAHAMPALYDPERGISH